MLLQLAPLDTLRLCCRYRLLARERERERRREGEIIMSSALSGTCARSEGALSKASDDIVDLELGGS